MKIWVTGAAGFLGSRLAHMLVSRGHHVVGLSRRPSATASESYAVDLTEPAAVDRLAALTRNGRPDIVVHAAAQQPGPSRSGDYVRGGLLTTATLLDALADTTPRLFIYTSTLSVYGAPERNPVRETDPLLAHTHYALSKLWSEQLTGVLARRVPVVVFRLPSLYGVGQGDSFIDGLAQVALRNETIELFSQGRAIRDALPVQDVMNAIGSAIEKKSWNGFTVMNLGGGRPVTSREYAEALLSALPTTSTIVPIDRTASQPDLYADISEARRQIAFEPTPLIQSMREYARALRA